MTRMIWNFEYFIVFTSAPGVLPEQNDRYRIQPWKVNEIGAYKKLINLELKEKKAKTKTSQLDLDCTEDLIYFGTLAKNICMNYNKWPFIVLLHIGSYRRC